MSASKLERISDAALIVGAPLTLAIVEVFHPHPHEILNVDLGRWLAIHYAQIPLFPLSALAVATLVRGRAGIAATACRVATFAFAIIFTAFDTAAGVVTGILVKAAHASGTPDAWRAPIDAVWMHPIMGGSPQMPAPPLLALLGSIALSIGTVTAAISLKRSGHSWGPVILLAISGFGISIFQTHAWPGGPLTFGGIAAAGGWLLFERARIDS